VACSFWIGVQAEKDGPFSGDKPASPARSFGKQIFGNAMGIYLK
jgi:hypothetical protein